MQTLTNIRFNDLSQHGYTLDASTQRTIAHAIAGKRIINESDVVMMIRPNMKAPIREVQSIARRFLNYLCVQGILRASSGKDEWAVLGSS